MTQAAHEIRLTDLLSRHVCEGLGPDEAEEFERLSRKVDGIGVEEIDFAAAALDLAFTDKITEAPAHVRDALERAGRAWLAGEVADDGSAAATAASGLPVAGSGRSMRVLAFSGWLAAAAMLLVAVTLWMVRPGAGPGSDPVGGVFLVTERVDAAPDVRRVAWQGIEGHELNHGIEGEVVWSPGLQRGYMVFRGLAQNNPSDLQYQLWIFDEARDERYPVDGGVFDVSRPCEEIVPIDARLPVSKATLFAVTVEPPGGVVVSERNIVALASLAD